MERWSYILAAALLTAAGIGVAAYRHADTGVPLLPDADRTVWQIEARIEFVATGEPAEVLLTLPPEQDGFLVLYQSESGASPGFGFTIDRSGPQRRAHWTKRSAVGQQTLFYQMDLVEDPQHRISPDPPGDVRQTHLDGPYATAASEVLNDLLPKSTSARVARRPVGAGGEYPAVEPEPEPAAAGACARTADQRAVEPRRHRRQNGEGVAARGTGAAISRCATTCRSGTRTTGCSTTPGAGGSTERANCCCGRPARRRCSMWWGEPAAR